MPCNEAVVFFARDLSAANLHFKLALKGPFELSYESWLVVAVIVIVELEVVEADGPVDVFQSPTDLDGEVFRFFRWHRSRQTRKGWGSSWCKVMGARTLCGVETEKKIAILMRQGSCTFFRTKILWKFVTSFCGLICCFQRPSTWPEKYAYRWKLMVLINNLIQLFIVMGPKNFVEELCKICWLSGFSL